MNNGEGKLKGGYLVMGIEILSVTPGGPAAVAGLRGRRLGLQTALTVGLVAGALFFPPAMFGVVVLQASGIGDSHELIIAVDGQRTRDVIDFDKAIEKAEGGEVVYLTVIRAGLREQIRVELPQRL